MAGVFEGRSGEQIVGGRAQAWPFAALERLSDRTVDVMAAHGRPRGPDELIKHNCLSTREFTSNWEYKAPDGRPGAVRVC